MNAFLCPLLLIQNVTSPLAIFWRWDVQQMPMV
uniref:Uncharacterized protein n=1 Tax=Zea mays TaxID=4577 RepID=C4J391_MAIZE|nr:unknown [Zea mays]